MVDGENGNWAGYVRTIGDTWKKTCTQIFIANAKILNFITNIVGSH
jgi:hypothetical protein